MDEGALTRLRSTISKLRKDLDRTRDRYDQTHHDLQLTEERIGALANVLHELDTQMVEQRRRLGELRAREAVLDASVAHQRDYLARQVRAAYAMGQQEYLRLLLNQENPATVGRVVVYYNYFNRARAERIGSLQASLRQLKALRSSLEQASTKLEETRKKRAREKVDYETTRKQRLVVLAKLKGDITAKDRHLEDLLSSERDLESVLVTVRRAVDEKVSNHQPFPRLMGKLPWPTPGPLQARFGAERAQGKLRWEGVLIRAAQGQAVRAVSSGRVVFADWLRGYGLLLIIDHGDGYMSLYAHNQSLFKETGDWVDNGDVIAAVGDSGGEDTDALYFEIRHNGQPVDPAKWCRRSHG